MIGVGTLKIGQTIDEKIHKLTVVNNLGLFSVQGRTCVATCAGAEGTSRSLAGQAKRGYDQLKAFMVIPPLDEKEKEAAEAVEDLIMLEVPFDSADERFRSYDSAADSYVEDDFFDWPIDGPRST